VTAPGDRTGALALLEDEGDVLALDFAFGVTEQFAGGLVGDPHDTVR